MNVITTQSMDLHIVVTAFPINRISIRFNLRLQQAHLSYYLLAIKKKTQMHLEWVRHSDAINVVRYPRAQHMQHGDPGNQKNFSHKKLSFRSPKKPNYFFLLLFHLFFNIWLGVITPFFF